MNLPNTVLYCFRYESCIEVEIQQRAVEYFALSRKGAALMDILAEMPKFPERQVCVFKFTMCSDQSPPLVVICRTSSSKSLIEVFHPESFDTNCYYLPFSLR